MSDTSVAKTEQSGVLADLLEVIWAPAKVFDRTRDTGSAKHILALSLIMLVVAVATWGLTRPFIEAAVDVQMQVAAKKGAQVPPEAIAASQTMAKWGSWIGSALFVPISAVVSGLLLFLAGKITSARVRYGQAVMIAALAAVTRLFALLAMAVIGAVNDPASISSAGQGSLGLARFVDPLTASTATATLATNIDIFSIWQLVLFAIGMSVVARVSRATGAFAALLAWAIATVAGVVPSLLVG